MEAIKLKIAVVIPCYKVEKHIEAVLAEIPAHVDCIIAVNDCSPDATGQKLKDLCSTYSKLVYLEHEANKGVGGAMVTGYRKALELGCHIAVKIDGDNQMDLAYLDSLLEPILKGKADFSKGNRFRDRKALREMPFIRRFGNIGLSFCIKAASGYWNIFDPTNGYTAVSREALLSMDLDKIHRSYFFESSMLMELYHAGAVVVDVPMKARYADEVSNLSVWRTLFEFPPKLLYGFIKRIILKYYLYEFNVASLYLLTGLPLLFLGSVYGIVNFIKYTSALIPAPTGTVVIPTLMITLGFQLILAAINYDLTNFPGKDNSQL